MRWKNKNSGRESVRDYYYSSCSKKRRKDKERSNKGSRSLMKKSKNSRDSIDNGKKERSSFKKN